MLRTYGAKRAPFGTVSCSPRVRQNNRYIKVLHEDRIFSENSCAHATDSCGGVAGNACLQFSSSNEVLIQMAHSRCARDNKAAKMRLGVLLSFRAQRSLRVTQACCPATAHTERFSLLCCQPEALFVSVATRTSLLTLGYPCRVHARQGHTISVQRRT